MPTRMIIPTHGPGLIGQFGAKIYAPIRRSLHVVTISVMRRRKIEKELV